MDKLSLTGISVTYILCCGSPTVCVGGGWWSDYVQVPMVPSSNDGISTHHDHYSLFVYVGI